MHSQLRQFEESHHYKNLKFEGWRHVEFPPHNLYCGSCASCCRPARIINTRSNDQHSRSATSWSPTVLSGWRCLRILLTPTRVTRVMRVMRVIRATSVGVACASCWLRSELLDGMRSPIQPIHTLMWDVLLTPSHPLTHIFVLHKRANKRSNFSCEVLWMSSHWYCIADYPFETTSAYCWRFFLSYSLRWYIPSFW